MRGPVAKIVMMEAARTSETSVDNYCTQQYTPENKSELRTHRRENLKSRIVSTYLFIYFSFFATA
jgi:hypothetical protein